VNLADKIVMRPVGTNALDGPVGVPPMARRRAGAPCGRFEPERCGSAFLFDRVRKLPSAIKGVVGEHIGAALRRREVRQDDARHLVEAEQMRGPPAVSHQRTELGAFPLGLGRGTNTCFCVQFGSMHLWSGNS